MKLFLNWVTINMFNLQRNFITMFGARMILQSNWPLKLSKLQLFNGVFVAKIWLIIFFSFESCNWKLNFWSWGWENSNLENVLVRVLSQVPPHWYSLEHARQFPSPCWFLKFDNLHGSSQLDLKYELTTIVANSGCQYWPDDRSYFTSLCLPTEIVGEVYWPFSCFNFYQSN